MEAKHVFSKFRIYYYTIYDQGSVISTPESFFLETCLTILLHTFITRKKIIRAIEREESSSTISNRNVAKGRHIYISGFFTKKNIMYNLSLNSLQTRDEAAQSNF